MTEMDVSFDLVTMLRYPPSEILNKTYITNATKNVFQYSISETAMGVKVNAQQNPNFPYTKALKEYVLIVKPNIF